MRNILPVVFLLLASSTWAQSQDAPKLVPPIAPKTIKTDKDKNVPSQIRPNSPKPSPPIDSSVSGKLETTSTDNKENTYSESNKWSDPLSIFTFSLVIATFALAWIAWRQDQTNRVVQRAYVKISHHPPGVQFPAPPSCEVPMRVKNFGQTPATITDVRLYYELIHSGDPLPLRPNYHSNSKPIVNKAFLVREEEYSFIYPVMTLSSDLDHIKNRTTDLCIYGYVDYIDQFGTHHRAGYARRFDPRGPIMGEGTNLNYITQPHYNYDRKRNKNEGDDWNELI